MSDARRATPHVYRPACAHRVEQAWPSPAGLWVGLSLILLGVTGCNGLLGLDIDFVDDHGVGGGGGQASPAASSSVGGAESGGGGGGGGCLVAVAHASDSFTDGDEAGWCRHLSAPTDAIVIANQEVTVRASESTWYNTTEGPFLYRSIAKEEDFAVVTRLDVTDDVGQPLAKYRRGAGLLVRAPDAGLGVDDENWVKLSVGYATPNGRGVAWSGTSGGKTSAPAVYLKQSPKAIAICRVGTLFWFYAYLGDAWQAVPSDALVKTQHAALTDSDRLQVGIVAHAAPNAPGEVVAKMRYVDFFEVSGTCLEALPADPLAAN